jgi:protein-tyrosine phosphatase
VFAYLNRMRQAQKPVYLHCEMGIGRTGTMLHALELMAGMTLDEAKQRIKLTRSLSQFSELTKRQQAFLQQLAEDLNP